MPAPHALSSLSSPEAIRLAASLAVALDLAAAALALLIMIDAWAPPQDLPWKPLRLDAPLGLATGWKFARAAASPSLCRKVLRDAGVAFQESGERQAGGCVTPNTLRLAGGLTALSPAAPLTSCPLALGYAFWTRFSVQPAALDELASPVVRVDHVGTFACRNIYGRAQAPLSEHARANAIDVTGFETASGRRVAIARDFRAGDSEGQFLRRVRDGACAWFHVVLSPDYNAAHRTHFHLDQGPYRACR